MVVADVEGEEEGKFKKPPPPGLSFHTNHREPLQAFVPGRGLARDYSLAALVARVESGRPMPEPTQVDE